MEPFERNIIEKIGDGKINKAKLKELKQNLLYLTAGKKVSATELAKQTDVSIKFILYCVNVGVLQEFGFDHSTQMFSRKLRVIK